MTTTTHDTTTRDRAVAVTPTPADAVQAGYVADDRPVDATVVASELALSLRIDTPTTDTEILVADSGALTVRFRNPDDEAAVGPRGAVGVGPAVLVDGVAGCIRSTASAITVIADGPRGPVVFPAPAKARRVAAGRGVDGNGWETVVLEDAVIDDPIPVSRGVVDDVRLRLALGRALLISGADRRCAELTTEHVAVREQFGRTLDHFGPVKQNIALLLEEVALVRTVTELAIDQSAEQPISVPDGARAAMLAAIVVAADAVEPITRIAHQLHGAIGFTELSDLSRFTTRMWQWRSDIGTRWHTAYGSSVLRSGGASLWASVTDTTAEVTR